MCYLADRVVFDTWGADVLRGRVQLEGAELNAHAAGWRTGILGVLREGRARLLGRYETPRERVAFVVGCGQGRVAAEVTS